jgi:flagellin-like protein
MNRRGISPLVATVLLVAFSVGLGALVMSWGEEYIEGKAVFVQGTSEVRTGCDAAQISLIKIGGLPQACRAPGAIQLWIDNGPGLDVFNIHARFAGSENVQVVEEILREPLLKENAIKVSIPYNPNIGEILQLKLTPKIFTGTSVVSCTEQAIMAEQIMLC